jgi:hypothetical protein
MSYVGTAAMPESHKIGLKEWTAWDQKMKIEFLTKCRNDDGTLIHLPPLATEKKLTLDQAEFATLVKNIDSLYKAHENRHMTIYGAVAVEVMKLRQCTPEEIANKLKTEQTRIAWGF